jgi:hypothetical protein
LMSRMLQISPHCCCLASGRRGTTSCYVNRVIGCVRLHQNNGRAGQEVLEIWAATSIDYPQFIHCIMRAFVNDLLVAVRDDIRLH